jgi:hypothetical protein
MGREKP